MIRIPAATILVLLALLAGPALGDEGASAPVGGAPAPEAAAADAPPTGGLDAALDAYERRVRLPEMVVTPTRGPRAVFGLPRQVSVIPLETLREEAPIHVVKSISQRNPGIVMDIRTGTTGDPIMRGFSGFNLLTLVDGNSLTTLWGEGGFASDDMYGKVDPDTVERIEIVHGPSSVLYGSNALGGVINIITRGSPLDYTAEGYDWGARGSAVYHSVNDGYRFRGEYYAATPVLKYLVGVSDGRYDHLEGGRGLGTLDPSDGAETNFDFRTDWRVGHGQELTLSVLRVRRTDIKRYYRPTQNNRNERLGVALTYQAERLAFMEPFTAKVYWQDKEDTRWFGGGKRGYARTRTISSDLQASTDLDGGHYLTYGAHFSRDFGESPDDEQFTYVRPRPKRSDSPDSEWTDWGLFVQDEWEVIEDLLTITGSARWDYLVFVSKRTSSYVPDVGNPRDDYFRSTKHSLTGGLGGSVKVNDEWRALFSWSRGFRQYAPNFGIRQVGNGVLVPNELLDPVTSDNFEIGARARYPFLDAEGFLYYSDIENWQVVRPGTWQGRDWYDFDGDGFEGNNESIVQQTSKNSAYVWGFEFRGTLYLDHWWPETLPGWSVWGGMAWNRGKVSDGEYLRHTQPTRGLLGIRWDDPDPERAAYFEFITEMVDRYHRIPSDRLEKDLAYRTDAQDGGSKPQRSYGGVAGYTIFSVYGGINVCENTRIRAGVENLTDKRYRKAHSRMDAPGINFIAGIEVAIGGK